MKILKVINTKAAETFFIYCNRVQKVAIYKSEHGFVCRFFFDTGITENLFTTEKGANMIAEFLGNDEPRLEIYL